MADVEETVGLASLRRAIKAGGVRAPISELMDFRLVDAGPNWVALEGLPGSKHYNPIGIVHGGFAATMLDSAAWAAVATTTSADENHTTLELKVNYMRPMTDTTGPVRCEGRVVHRGGRVAIAEAKITDGAGKLYAQASSTLMIIKQ